MDKSDMLPERLNWKQACALLGCGKTKFYGLIKKGELTAHRSGKRGLWVLRKDCERIVHSVSYIDT